MAKGGGKGKGRPRKLIAAEGKLQTPNTGSKSEKGGSSNATQTNETVNLEEQRDEEESQLKIHINTDLDVETKQEIAVLAESKQNPRQGSSDLLRTKGMRLDFVAPTLKDGNPTACLVQSELEKETLKWQYAVILYVIGDVPTIAYLTSFIQKQCQIGCKFEIYYHTEGYFVVRFESGEGKDRMLYEGPHTISSRPVIVKEWMPNFCFEKEILRKIPLWVRLPKLPLNCWSNDSLSRIGSVLGTPVCADECTSEQKRISYARLLVDIDVTQPLKYKVKVVGENGNIIEQKVVYEWVPLFCKKCQMIGHICNDTQQKAPAKPPQKLWLRKGDEGRKTVSNRPNKGKEVAIGIDPSTSTHETWSIPSKAVSQATIQVGNIHIPTGNAYEGIPEEGESDEDRLQGGDLFPLLQ